MMVNFFVMIDDDRINRPQQKKFSGYFAISQDKKRDVKKESTKVSVV